MTLQSTAKDQLRAFVSRIERLEEEKASLGTDLKEVYAEVKAFGFDTKALRKIIAIRKQDDEKRREEEAIIATYLHALDMQGDLFAEPEQEDPGMIETPEERAMPDLPAALDRRKQAAA